MFGLHEVPTEAEAEAEAESIRVGVFAAVARAVRARLGRA